MAGRPRGARPARRHILARATPHVRDPLLRVPPSFLMWGQLNMWGNDQYGDCVTAEEAAKLSLASGIFTPLSEVIAWAKKHHVLNGADLPEVMAMMEKNGLVVGSSTYDDGPYLSVDWTNYEAICAAMYENQPKGNPIKIGIDSSLLEQMVDNPDGSISNGWIVWGYPESSNYDHCTSLVGFGNASDLVGLFGGKGVDMALPADMPAITPCAAMFTWGTIGLVDMQSLVNMCGEAWVRNPPTIVR
jgi:hypothetical protein